QRGPIDPAGWRQLELDDLLVVGALDQPARTPDAHIALVQIGQPAVIALAVGVAFDAVRAVVARLSAFTHAVAAYIRHVSVVLDLIRIRRRQSATVAELHLHQEVAFGI